MRDKMAFGNRKRFESDLHPKRASRCRHREITSKLRRVAMDSGWSLRLCLKIYIFLFAFHLAFIVDGCSSFLRDVVPFLARRADSRFQRFDFHSHT